MIMKLIRTLPFIALSLTVTISGLAQEREMIRSAAGNQYVISANAGGVNYTEGRVVVDRKDTTSGYLVKGQHLKVGDRVKTDSNSRVEILLNPGSYARLGSDTQFEFATTGLDDLQLRLISGSAIFEVYASDDFKVTVLTPGTRFYLIKSGVYRVDALEDGSSRIEVRKGKAQIGSLNAEKLKKARAALVSGGNIEISKFKRKDRDQFETWSRDRAKRLADANARLERKTLRNSLWNSYRSRGWDTFNSYGLWTYSSSFGGYCFLPFGYGWRSPYGFGLNRDLYYFRLPRVVYYVPRVIPRVNRAPVRNASTLSNDNGTRRSIRRAPISSPPERIARPSGAPRRMSPGIRRTSPNIARPASRRPVNMTPRSSNPRAKVQSRIRDQ